MTLSAGLAVLLAFALGSLLGGQILGRLSGADLRATGSGNLGATNALRAGGTRLGVAVLLVDLGKGWLAAGWVPMLAPQVAGLPWVCGLAAVLGHVFSPLAGFRGGKGVATSAGSLLALLPWGLALGLAGFLPCLLLTGYVSLSVLLAGVLVLFYVACLSSAGAVSAAGLYAAGLLLLLIWSHRANIGRLARGQESRFDKLMLRRRRP